MFTFKSRIRLKYNFGCILFSLFLRKSKSRTAWHPINNHRDEELPIRLAIHAVFWEGVLERLTPTHKLVLVVIINERGLNLGE
jgi:hypothetical protein